MRRIYAVLLKCYNKTQLLLRKDFIESMNIFENSYVKIGQFEQKVYFFFKIETDFVNQILIDSKSYYVVFFIRNFQFFFIIIKS